MLVIQFLGEMSFAKPPNSGSLTPETWRRVFLTNQPDFTGLTALLLDPKEFTAQEIETLTQFLATPEAQKALTQAAANREKYMLDIRKRAQRLLETEYRGVPLQPFLGVWRSFQAFVDVQTRTAMNPVTEETAANRARSAVELSVSRLSPFSLERSQSDMNRRIGILQNRELNYGEELRRARARTVDQTKFEAWRQQELQRLEKERAEVFAHSVRLILELYPGELVYAEPEEPSHVINLDKPVFPVTAETIKGATFFSEPLLDHKERAQVRGDDTRANSPRVPVRWFIRMSDGKKFGLATHSSRDNRIYQGDETESHDEYVTQMRLPAFMDRRYLEANLTSQERAAKFYLLKQIRTALNQSEMQVSRAVRGIKTDGYGPPLVYSPNLSTMILEFTPILNKQAYQVPVNTPFWNESGYGPDDPSPLEALKRFYWLTQDFRSWSTRDRLAAEAGASPFPAGRDVDKMAYYRHIRPTIYSDALRELMLGPLYGKEGEKKAQHDPLRFSLNEGQPEKPRNAKLSAEHEIVLFQVERPVSEDIALKYLRTGLRTFDIKMQFYHLAYRHQEHPPEEVKPLEFAGEVSVKTKASYHPVDGIINIPTPRYHLLTSLELETSRGEPLKLGEDYQLKRQSDGTAYFIELKGRFAQEQSELFKFRTTFTLDKSAPKENAPVPPQLLKLNHKMMDLSKQLQNAGLNFLAMGVRELFLDYKMRGLPVTIFDIERTFSQFSQKPPKNFVPGQLTNLTGPFVEWSQFVDRNGILCVYCGPAILLLKAVVNHILPEAKVEAVVGFSPEELSDRVDLAGKNRHVVLKVNLPGFSEVWLDSTPPTVREAQVQLAADIDLPDEALAAKKSFDLLQIYLNRMDGLAQKVGAAIARGRVNSHHDDPWSKTLMLAQNLRDYMTGRKTLAEVGGTEHYQYISSVVQVAVRERQRIEQINQYARNHPTMSGAAKYLNFELKLAMEELADHLKNAEVNLASLAPRVPVNSCREKLVGKSLPKD